MNRSTSSSRARWSPCFCQRTKSSWLSVRPGASSSAGRGEVCCVDRMVLQLPLHLVFQPATCQGEDTHLGGGSVGISGNLGGPSRWIEGGQEGEDCGSGDDAPTRF